MRKVVIIGGGLAGTALAYVLRRAGAQPVIYEAAPSLASGASGNALGLYNPRFSAEYTSEAQYYAAAFFAALEVFEELQNIDWTPCGALHLITNEKKETRFHKMAQSWGWDAEDLQMLSAQEASDIAGLAIAHDALYLPRSGYVSPKKLCAAYAEGIEIHLNTAVDQRADIDADVVVLACGTGALKFEEAAHLPLKGVRGQVSDMRASAVSRDLKCNICYGGYITASHEGAHMLGSTFQRWLDHSDVMPEDDQKNIERLYAAVPVLSDGMEVIGSRAAVRTTAPDNFPVVGKLSEGVYISGAHGSHGIISSLMAARVIAAMILDEKPSLPQATLACLDPLRYDPRTAD